MARFDGNGPRGDGPMTGKAMGYCAGHVSERPYFGREYRRRPQRNMGFGRSMGNRFSGCRIGRYYVEDAEYMLDSKDSLEREKGILEDRLNKINKELNDLKDE